MEISLSLRSLRRSIAGLSLLALLASMSFAGVAKAQTFSDVDPDAWYYEYVEALADQGVVEGYDNGTFGPGDTLNRAQAAKIMVLAFAGESELDYDYDAGFPDVDEDAWYAVYVNTAQKLGIVEGYDNGTFGPGDDVNRAAFAKMVVNAAGLETDLTDAPHFSDVDEDAWYYDYVETAYNNSVIDGYSDGTFKPGNDVNRAEACKMVYQGQNPELRYGTGDDDTGDDDTGDDDTGDDDTGDDDTGDDTTTVGTLKVEMGDVLPATSLPKGATTVEMLNLIFTAEGGDVELDGLVIRRTGVGAAADYAYIYLYEGATRLSNGRTIATDTNEATFTALNKTIAEGDSLELTIVADVYSSATTGDENVLEIYDVDAIESDATEVTGTFPIESEVFTISGSSAGGITIAKNGSVADPTIGDTDIEVAEFSLAASSAEDMAFTRLTLTIKGTIENAALTNFKLLQGSDTIATAESVENDLVTFVVDGNYNCSSYTYTDDGYCIGKGNTKIFNVTADVGIVADPGDTIRIYLDESTDLGTVGLVYGYGTAVTYTSYDNGTNDGTDASWSTVLGGQVTLSQDGPASDDVAINAKDIVLEQFNVTSARNVEFKRLVVTVTATGSGLLASTTVRNFSDIKIVELNESGEIIDTLMSAQDLSLSGSDSSQQLTYTDTWTMAENTTKIMAITCDVANIASLDGTTITAQLDAISTTEGIRDTDTNEYITDIVPASAVAGNAMTVRSSSLTAALATTPISDTYVGGNVNLATFTLTAGAAMNITITQIDVSGYLDDNASTYTKGVDNSIYIRDVISNVWLEDADGNQIGTEESFSTAGEASFSGLSWVITKGTTESLKVYGYINTAAPYNSNNDAVSVDLLDGDIVCQDEEGNTVNAGGDNSNGTTSPTVVMTISSGGTLAIAENTTDAAQDKITATSEDEILLGKFKATATDEDFKITKMTFASKGKIATSATGLTFGADALKDNISSYILKYPTDVDNPTTLDGEVEIAMSGTHVTFEDLTLMVPKDSSSYFEVYADIAGHTNDSTGGADSDDALQLVFNTGDTDGSEGDFAALGQGSGTGYDEGELADVSCTNFTYIYRTVPTVANSTSLSSSLIPGADKEVYRFTVTADENYDLVLYYLTLDISQTGLVTGATANSLGNAITTNADTGSGKCNGGATYTAAPWFIKEYSKDTYIGTGCYDPTNGYVKFELNTSNGTLGSGIIVGEGTTKTFSVYADVFEDADSSTTASLSLRIHQDTSYVAGAKTALQLVGTNNTNLAVTGMVWSDYGIQSGQHGSTIAEWITGYKIPGMPISYMTLN